MNVKTISAAVFAVMTAFTSQAARNLIANFDHSERIGIDLPMGWTKQIRHKLVTKLEVRPEADGAVRFTAGGDSHAFYEQRNLKLVPGGKYRVSYEVKTSGLRGAAVYVFLRDSKWSWRNPQMGPRFPDDTGGKWVKQEKILTMCDHPDADGHTLTISCVNGKNVPEIEFLMRNLRLEALDGATDRASAPIGGRDREKLVARIVPVDPLLSDVDAGDARMTFYWPGAPSCGVTRCRVVARLGDGNAGRPVSALFDAKGYATVRFGRLRPSKYGLDVEVTDEAGKSLAKNSYGITVKHPVKTRGSGRRLNNFVTSLVDGPLENGEVTFVRGTPGWVWISFEGDVGTAATGYLDKIACPVVRYRAGESRIETQRFVTAGEHTLRISGVKPGGRLRINAVKTIWGQVPYLTTEPSSVYFIGFRYTLPFFNRFGIHTPLNTTAFRVKLGQHVDPVHAGYVYERGMRAFANMRANPDGPLYDDFEAALKHLSGGPWASGFPISVDENKVNQCPRRAVNYSEAAWRMVADRPSQSMNLFYADTSYGNYFDCPQINVSEISATVNSGDGTGLLCPELYATVRETPGDLDRYLDSYAKIVTSAEEMVPASRGKVVLYGATYVQIGTWSNYIAPSTDIKAHYAKMYRAFATDPRFEGCAGVGCGGQNSGGEELLRWMAKCVRYYALEGGTGDMAGEYGFSWAPGFVKNPDMDEGLANWTVKGEIAAERLPGYGSRIQKRQTAPRGYGDGTAVFTARKSEPNELSQEIAGLEPGKHYALLFCVADRDDVVAKKGMNRGKSLAFSARLEGADEFPDLRCETVSAVRAKLGMRLIRYVFRARSDRARLVLTDRKDDGTAPPEGFRQAVNYVSFMPYYVESPDETAEIAKALGWKGPDRVRL